MARDKKIIAVIPARLNSKRLSNKLLLKIENITILEHVIIRLILSDSFSKIIVTSPNSKIKKLIEKYKNVDFYKSKLKHFSGTSRAIEAVKKLKFSKLVIIFGDEPLVRPDEIRYFTNQIYKDKKNDIWNATISIKNKQELIDKSVVKCLLNSNQNIYNLKRHINSNLNKNSKSIVHKSVGLIAFKSKIVKNLNLKKNTENIEQLNFIRDNKYLLKSVKLKHDFFSVNTLKDFKRAKSKFKSSRTQKNISLAFNLKN